MISNCNKVLIEVKYKRQKIQMWKLSRIPKILNMKKVWNMRNMYNFRGWRLRFIPAYNKVISIKKRNFSYFEGIINIQKLRLLLQYIKIVMIAIVIGTLIITLCFFFINMYIQKINTTKLREQLITLYPNQTCMISLVEQSYSQNQNINTIYINDKQLADKLGPTVFIFSPTNIDQLCQSIQKIKTYHHSTLIINSSPLSNTPQPKLIIKTALLNLQQPQHKHKYIVINIEALNKIQIDQINNTVKVQTGITGLELNKYLRERGFQVLFMEQMQNNSLYHLIVNNLPLISNQPMMGKIKSLSLVTPDGTIFQPTDVINFNQVPNLASLYVGSGGAFGIPISVTFPLQKKPLVPPIIKQYLIESNNSSELVSKWRQIRQTLTSKQIKYILRTAGHHKLLIETVEPLDVTEYIDLHQHVGEKINCGGTGEYLFSVSNRIVEKLMIYWQGGAHFQVQNNVLTVKNISDEEVNRLVSIISFEKGVLVWCKDSKSLNPMKQKLDLHETGIGYMNKMVQIRQVLDRNKIMGTHFRYEQYFSKNLFRRVTQFFW